MRTDTRRESISVTCTHSAQLCVNPIIVRLSQCRFLRSKKVCPALQIKTNAFLKRIKERRNDGVLRSLQLLSPRCDHCADGETPSPPPQRLRFRKNSHINGETDLCPPLLNINDTKRSYVLQEGRFSFLPVKFLKTTNTA